ncbi:uncharacterized protein LOC123562083 [Mercenaria mercenaria]|uniref:uncharacterized protein LOC123562083 n=1 Tax=Mercenaria mercenaria TaxID=6596 RepID=UPI00234E82EA|nr:uncharacterized protein LOC123562083 [Mercenaria mercenaria]
MKNKTDMSVWCYTRDIFMMVMLSTFQIYAVEAFFPYRHDNTCSSRPDQSCIRCNGIPECFDLSDETGCSNTTFKFVSVQNATKSCRDRNCLKVFPGPPPLPPFSLCDSRQLTTKFSAESTTVIPITTKPTRKTAPSSPVTTKPTTETAPSSPVTIKPTTPSQTSSATTKQPTRQPCRTTRRQTTTQSPFWPTTQWWDRTTSQRPVVVTTTASPPWSTTQWIPTTTLTTERFFMKMWRFCASRYRYNRDIYSCAVKCFLRCYSSRGWPGSLDGGSAIFDCVESRIAPTTVANSLFNAVPTQLFPTFQPATNPPVETHTRVDQDYYNSNRITNQDLSYIYILSRLLNN